MSKTPFSVKEMGSYSIDEDTVSRGGDSCHDPVDEIMWETQVNKEHFDIKPTSPVKSF